MLPISSASGATSRTAKLAAAPSSLPSMMRCEPSIMPMPSFWAAAARLRLMTPESSAPPVIAPISTGASQTHAEELGVQVDCAEIRLGQRVVGQRDALKAGRHGLVVHGFGQAHVDVPGLAGLPCRVHRHRLPVLRQWQRVRRSLDRNRGHRRSGRRCSRGVRPGPIAPRQDPPRLVHQHRHCHTGRSVRRIHRLFGHLVHTIVSICDGPAARGGAAGAPRHQRPARRR